MSFSGGNIDVTILSRVIKRGLLKSGRSDTLTIQLEDRPGQLRLVLPVPEIVRRFVAGMAASKLLILEGISGTGKTSLPYSFSRYQ